MSSYKANPHPNLYAVRPPGKGGEIWSLCLTLPVPRRFPLNSPPMKYSSRFFLYAPVSVFLLLFAFAGVRWWVLASAWSDRLAAMNGHEVMPGVTLHFAGRQIAGFPFTLETRLDNVTLAIATPAGQTRWLSEKLALHRLTYGRDETIFEAAGRQTLEWTGANGSHVLPFAVGSLRASAIRKHGELVRFDLDLVGFGSEAFTAQRLQFHAKADGDSILFLDEADGLFTKRSCIKDSHLRYEATLTAAKALDPLLAGSVPYQAGLAAWRSAGGTIHAAQTSPLAAIPAEQVPGIEVFARALCP
jgi:hypothetical protein